MLGWLKRVFQTGSRKGEAMDFDFESYTDAVGSIKELKSAGRHDELERLLMWCVEDTEDRDRHSGVAPYYFEQLAILYRKQGRYADEVAILERFEEQPHARGKKPQKLIDRLERARELADG